MPSEHDNPELATTIGYTKRLTTDNMTNCFSIDVESFVESNLESFEIAPAYIDKAKENYEIETNMNVLLELLGALNIQATFFFVGRIARDIPQIVRLTAQMGHEIGCHSFEHLRIFRLNRGPRNHGAACIGHRTRYCAAVGLRKQGERRCQ